MNNSNNDYRNKTNKQRQVYKAPGSRNDSDKIHSRNMDTPRTNTAKSTQSKIHSHSAVSNRKPPKKKTSFGKMLIVTLLLIAMTIGAIYFVVDKILINTGDAGSLGSEIFGTIDEYKGDVVNVLVAGIDYDADDDGRDYSEGLGMTDVIMYVNFDLVTGQCNILQIPRDMYVGDSIPTGKINAVYSHGEDKENRISNLAKVLNDQYKLPVDHFVTLDMSAFKTIIDTLGGIEMYVPWDVYDDYGNTVPQGLQKIDGATAEFIVRQRHMYANADIQRLEIQRYFYSAVFKTFLTFPMKDLAKVAPAVLQYVNTDFTVTEMLSLFTSLQKLDSSKILFGKLPCAGAMAGSSSVLTANKEETARILNTYFRAYGVEASADELAIPQLTPTTDWIIEEPSAMGGLDNGETVE